MPKYFGTDGIRGIANVNLTPDFALKLGKSTGYVLGKNKNYTIIVGKDTRLSSDMLENAIISGLASVGHNVLLLGIIPTPAIPYLIISKKIQSGIMISASHNPAQDNGIKIWDKDGKKLSEKKEEEIEKYLDLDIPLARSENIGRIKSGMHLSNEYTNYLKKLLKIKLSDIKMIIDCANGSASYIAQEIFSSYGAKVSVINSSPNGVNINYNCGALHPEVIKNKVAKDKVDIGISFDGDADRAILCDEKGNIITGDHILAVIGLYLKKRGKLNNNTVVATVMSNMGLEILFRKKNINLVRCPVGDKYVLQTMTRKGAIFGGEQAGHIIFSRYNTSSDGIFTSLQIMQIMKKENKTLSELASVLTLFPQVLVNVKVEDKERFKNNEKIQEEIRKIEYEMKGKGRILVRPSGTENLIRIMVEGEDEDKIKKYADRIKELVENAK